MTDLRAGCATIVDVLAARAAATPGALAFAMGDRRVTYGGLLREVDRLARALAARGLGRGERCARVLPSGLDAIAAIYAVLSVGAVPVVMQWNLPPDLVLKRARRVRAAIALGHGPTVASLAAAAAASASASAAGAGPAPPRFVAFEELAADGATAAAAATAAPGPADREGLAYIQLTSGTTGEPRAAAITHRNLMACLAASASIVPVREGDPFVGWVPPHHDLGLIRFVFQPVYFGCPCHLVEPSIASLGRWLETMAAVRAVLTASPDFGYRIAALTVPATGLDLGALRYATNGGEAVRASTIESFERKFGVPGAIRPGYGLAEATLGVTGVRCGEPIRVDERGNVSCGRPVSGTEVRLAGGDDDREPLAGEPGEAPGPPPGGPQPAEPAAAREGARGGEILVRSAQVFAGYDGDEEATREALRGGWLHTGDIGTFDADGNLYVIGRKRAIIKRAGAIISPREVEEAADAVPGVRSSAAVGVPGRGALAMEDVVVVAEARAEDTAAEAARAALAARVSEAVAVRIGFSPAWVAIVPPRTIPRTPNGKIRYPELRRAIEDGSIPGPGPSPGGSD